MRTCSTALCCNCARGLSGHLFGPFTLLLCCAPHPLRLALRSVPGRQHAHLLLIAPPAPLQFSLRPGSHTSAAWPTTCTAWTTRQTSAPLARAGTRHRSAAAPTVRACCPRVVRRPAGARGMVGFLLLLLGACRCSLGASCLRPLLRLPAASLSAACSCSQRGGQAVQLALLSSSHEQCTFCACCRRQGQAAATGSRRQSILFCLTICSRLCILQATRASSWSGRQQRRPGRSAHATPLSPGALDCCHLCC